MSEFLLQNLEILSNLPGAPGFEEPVVDCISGVLSGLNVDFKIDRIGNLVCCIKGDREGQQKDVIHFDAHTDEPGFMVKNIDSHGRIFITTIGFFVLETVIGQRVKIITDFKGEEHVKGTFCVKSVHAKVEKSDSLDHLWIDIGETSREAVQNLGIKPGNSVVFDAPFSLFNGGKRMLGKALDDRAGCAVLLDAIRLLNKDTLPNDVYFSFSSQEEFLLKGAHAVFNTIKSLYGVVPKISISLDIGICGAPSGFEASFSGLEMGKGPGIKVRDKSNVSHYSHVTNPRLVAILEEIAVRNNIPFQYDFLPGCTNADVYGTYDCGVYAGGLGFATRNSHSPVEIVDLDDLKATSDFVVAIAKESEAFDSLR